eukprot:GAHX01004165.1.p2 GENE.GAHX01004165.1~~GAHX01004165.1.p2  ORF type:complete len:58 (-),score=3.40 GAHX01004165.1:1206-1379(-)
MHITFFNIEHMYINKLKIRYRLNVLFVFITNNYQYTSRWKLNYIYKRFNASCNFKVM